MRTTPVTILTLGLLAGAVPAAAGDPADAIEGLDPVALVNRGEEVQGKDDVAVVRGRFRYLFASAEDKAAFLADPERFEIQLGGLCARMGGTTLGIPDLFAVYDGRIYVFGSPGCRTAFLASPESYLPPPPAAWSGGEEARAAGRAALERAASAAGGARLDAIRTYRERRAQRAWWSDQELFIRTTFTTAFPDRWRADREIRSTISRVLTPRAAFQLTPGGAEDLIPAQRENLERDRRREVLEILRHRAELQAVALGLAEVAGRLVERLAVDWDGTVSVLGLDPESGRVLTEEYTGRGAGSAWGEVVEVFSDFRDVSGLTLPFERRSTWNGEPDRSRTAAVEEAAVDFEVPASFFERPAEPEEKVAVVEAPAPAPAAVRSRPAPVEPMRIGGAWPQWGGPGRDFRVEDAGLATVWPAAGPPVLWRRELGEGYSAVAAVDGVLYTMLRRGEDEVAVALDAKTGETLWEEAEPAPFADGYSMENGPGPHATPLVVGERVFVAGSTAKVRALDRRTGARLWSHDLIAEYGATLRVNGYACSPIAYGDTVILMAGGPGHAVMAFRQDDGRVAWSSGDFRNSASSPLLVDVGGEAELVAFLYSEIAGFHPQDGSLLWSHPHAPEFGLNVSLPVYDPARRLLFFSSAYGGGAKVLELRPVPSGGPRGELGPGTSGKPRGELATEVWAHSRMKIHFGNAVRFGDRVLGSSGGFGPAPLVAVEMGTGKIAWRHRGFARAMLLAVGERLLLLDEDGVLALATPEEEGLVVHAQAQLLSPPARTVPTLVGTTLYLRDRKVLLALDLRAPRPAS